MKHLKDLTHEQEVVVDVLWGVMKNRERASKWYKDNLEKGRDNTRRRRKENPEYVTKGREQARERYQKSEEVRSLVSMQSAARYAENPEELKRKVRQWQKEHPEETREIRRAAKHRRRARKKQQGGSFTASEWLQLKKTFENSCLCCGRTEETLNAAGLKLVPDHVVSLKQGGTSDISNIQPLCHGIGGCNNVKGAKSIDYR